MKLKFSKMHGLGNDFVVIDGVRQSVSLTRECIQQWGNRHLGIGFDQLLLVATPSSKNNDFSYRIFNNNGEEVEQCGNGARCFARFVIDQHLSTKHTLRVETINEVILLQVLDDGRVSVNMGIPLLEPTAIPFDAQCHAIIHVLDVAGEAIDITVVSMGNPHAITIVHDIHCAPVLTLGPLIESHPRFPKRVNAGFMQINSRENILLRVYERGVGETLACGSGACAAVVAGILRGVLDKRVNVHTRGGELMIEWEGPGTPVRMVGPATTVFTGEIDL